MVSHSLRIITLSSAALHCMSTLKGLPIVAVASQSNLRVFLADFRQSGLPNASSLEAPKENIYGLVSPSENLGKSYEQIQVKTA